jgi:hypothetical protein
VPCHNLSFAKSVVIRPGTREGKKISVRIPHNPRNRRNRRHNWASLSVPTNQFLCLNAILTPALHNRDRKRCISDLLRPPDHVWMAEKRHFAIGPHRRAFHFAFRFVRKRAQRGENAIHFSQTLQDLREIYAA